MGQFFSWVKSNEKQILVILDNLAKKGVEVSEAVVVMPVSYTHLTLPTNREV